MLMADEVSRAGIHTVFRTSNFGRSWQVMVTAAAGAGDVITILGVGTGGTEEAACADCLWSWSRRRGNRAVPNAGSLEELRLKMSIGGRT